MSQSDKYGKHKRKTSKKKKKRTEPIGTCRFESGHSCSKEEKREKIIEGFSAVLKWEILGRLQEIFDMDIRKILILELEQV